MITLKELFDDLSYGEFANMSIGNSSVGSITADKYPKVISFFNLALLDLYTRFRLKKKECIIYQREDKNLYYVRSAHLGDPMAGDPEIYIDGTVDEPPSGDIIKFIEAYDQDGVEIFINKAMHPEGIFLPEPDIIKITPTDILKIMTIEYQASYPKISLSTNFDPSTYELYIPGYIRSALLANIAARLFVGKESKALEGEISLTRTFQYRYETECNKISNLGMVPDVEEGNSHFTNGGWV